MKLSSLLALLAVFPAHAMDAACETYLDAAEKSSAQPARHNLTLLDDGTRIESISIGGDFYALSGGTWRKIKMDVAGAERKLYADIRSGRIKLDGCSKLGNETLDGVATSVVSYTITIPGTEPASAQAYIGKDGLIHGQSSPQMKLRYRYAGVTAPKV